MFSSTPTQNFPAKTVPSKNNNTNLYSCQYLSKWTDSSEICIMCKSVHNISHMLYNCKLARYIWDGCIMK